MDRQWIQLLPTPDEARFLRQVLVYYDRQKGNEMSPGESDYLWGLLTEISQKLRKLSEV